MAELAAHFFDPSGQVLCFPCWVTLNPPLREYDSVRSTYDEHVARSSTKHSDTMVLGVIGIDGKVHAMEVSAP